MKGIRFYEEFENKRKGKTANNVTAVIVENGTFKSGDMWCYDAITGIHHYSNSPVASSGVSIDWLRENCKRISEEKAREIHPALFEYLDQED